MNCGILVVEDDPITQRMIAVNLERAGYEVRCVGGVVEAEGLIGERLPELILLDWVLPKATGVSLLRRLRFDPRTRDIPVIMLTSRGHDTDKVTGLDSGADDYITKPFSPRELLARVKALLRRRAPQATDEVVEIGGLRIDPVLKRVTAGGKTFDTGAIEFRMLHFFATHPGRVFSRETLLDKLWGDQVFVQDRTVDAHIRALRHLLRPSGLHALIETVRGEGYCFRRELPEAEVAMATAATAATSATSATTPVAAPSPQPDFFALEPGMQTRREEAVLGHH
jgi:two-component system phosphate regulon response regulator PhoB